MDIVTTVWNYFKKINGAEPTLGNRFLTREEIVQRAQEDNTYNRH